MSDLIQTVLYLSLVVFSVNVLLNFVSEERGKQSISRRQTGLITLCFFCSLLMWLPSLSSAAMWRDSCTVSISCTWSSCRMQHERRRNLLWTRTRPFTYNVPLVGFLKTYVLLCSTILTFMRFKYFVKYVTTVGFADRRGLSIAANKII